MAQDKHTNIAVIILGGLSTDIVVYNLPHLPQPGEKVFGDNMAIGPAGESGNIARMTAALTGPEIVAMISRTSQDPFGLWKPPYDALLASGVNTDYITMPPLEESKKFPSIALVSIDIHGNRNASAVSGASNDFSEGDIDNALPLFASAQKNNGILALSLELPIKTAFRAIETANQYNLKVILDPGGMAEKDKEEILKQKLYLIKPNEQETKMLTGISISNIDTAQLAAEILMEQGIKNVLITHGENGAYFFTKGTKLHLPNPKIPNTTDKDSTGCGEQVLATICAGLIQRKELTEAVKNSIIAGALQFSKAGLQPITPEELEAYLH